MKSNFARCAVKREDKRGNVEYDTSYFGNVFSQQAANSVFKACHRTPQMHDMEGNSDSMHGAERYVTSARKPFAHSSSNKRCKKDDMSMLFVLGVMEAVHASHGDSLATHGWNAPQPGHYH